MAEALSTSPVARLEKRLLVFIFQRTSHKNLDGRPRLDSPSFMEQTTEAALRLSAWVARFGTPAVLSQSGIETVPIVAFYRR